MAQPKRPLQQKSCNKLRQINKSAVNYMNNLSKDAVLKKHLIKNWLQNTSIYTHIERFIQIRSPRCDDVTLGIKNVYVFLDKNGILFVLLLLLTFVLGVNYSNNLVLGLCFYLSAIWFVSIFYTFVQVSDLHIKLMEVPLSPSNQKSYVLVELSSKSGKPSQQITLYFDQADDDKKAEITHIALVDKVTLCQVAINTKKRGKMILPRLIVKSTYPFGVIQAWSYVYFATPMYVYPEPISINDEEIYQKIKSDDNAQNYTLGQEDFSHLQEYILGENLSRVSWVHLARGQEMLTKKFSEQMGTSWQLNYTDMPAKDHETKLSQLCFLVDKLSQTQTPFSLVLPSQTQPSQIGVGDAFARQSLLRLALEPKV